MNVIVRGRRFCSGGKSLGKMDFESKNKRVAFYIIHSLERFSCPAGTELKYFFCLVNKSLSLLTDFFFSSGFTCGSLVEFRFVRKKKSLSDLPGNA